MQRFAIRYSLLLILVAFLQLRPASLCAELKLAQVFTDHMVLQQEIPIAIWGTAEPGSAVTVSFNAKVQNATADKLGNWKVELPAMSVDGVSHTLSVVAGKESVACMDVLLGEVWICGGQSNMGRPVTGEQIKTADNSKIRLFNVSGNVPRDSGIDDTFGWAVCTPESIAKAGDGTKEKGRRGFTEVGYVFGRRIQSELKVPVGLIQMNCGGSTAKDWTPTEGVRDLLVVNEPMKGLTHKPGVLYEVRMRGVVPFTARGVVWYQGEDDGRNKNYDKDFADMIAAWRSLFGRKDLPFYFAQIAQTTYASGMLRVWESQQWVMENVQHTGLAVSNDIYDGTKNGGFKLRVDTKTGLPIAGGSNPHPTGKDKVAERLANIALAKTYGRDRGVIFGPMYKSHEIVDGRVRVTFQHTGTGLRTNDDNAPNWFEVSDGSKEGRRTKYSKAKAKIVDENVVEVWAEGVEPKEVRFGWHPLARFNLVNAEGLPAVSFRTDSD